MSDAESHTHRTCRGRGTAQFGIDPKVVAAVRKRDQQWFNAHPGRTLSFAKNMSDLEALLHQSISERGESGSGAR